jgi:hypothetical protein
MQYNIYIYICPFNLMQSDAPMLRLSYIYNIVGEQVALRLCVYSFL